MYSLSRESEGYRRLREEVLGHKAPALCVLGVASFGVSSIIEAFLLDRLQQQQQQGGLKRLSELSLSSPQLMNYVRGSLARPLASADARRVLWESLSGEKLLSSEGAKQLLRGSSKLRLCALGTLGVILAAESVQAYSQGAAEYDELFATGRAPISLTQNNISQSGTLSLRLVSDTSPHYLSPNVIPISLTDEDWRRSKEAYMNRVLPLERISAPYIVSEALNDYERSRDRQRQSSVRKIVMQSLSLSDSQATLSSHSVLQRNFLSGHELALRLYEKEKEKIKETTAQPLVLPQLHHVHVCANDEWRNAWGSTSNTHTLQHTFSAAEEEFVDASLRSLFPALSLSTAFLESDACLRLRALLRSAYCMRELTVSDTQRTQRACVHLVDVRPLLAAQTLYELSVALSLPLPLSINTSQPISNTEEDTISPTRTQLLARLYTQYIAPWDCALSLSWLTMRVGAKYALYALDTVGSAVRATLWDDETNAQWARDARTQQQSSSSQSQTKDDSSSSRSASTQVATPTKPETAVVSTRKREKRPRTQRIHTVFLLDDVSASKPHLNVESTEMEALSVKGKDENAVERGLTDALATLGVGVSPLSACERDDLLCVRDKSSRGNKTSAAAVVDLCGRVVCSAWNVCFANWRYACLYAHDVLSEVSGVEAPRLLLAEKEREREREQDTQEEQEEEEEIVTRGVIIAVVRSVEELPYRLFLLAQRFPQCSVAVVLAKESEVPLDAHAQSLVQSSLAHFSQRDRPAVLVDAHELIAKLWSIVPVQ